MSKKRLYLVASLLSMLGGVSPSLADPYQPFSPFGGLDKTTTIPGVYADGSSGTLSQIGQMADGSVQQTDVGKTVAPLDSNGNMPSTLKGVNFVDTFGNTRKLDTPDIPDTDFSNDSTKKTVVAYRKNQVLTPEDFGVSFDGSDADAVRLQTYIDTVRPSAIKAKGLWPVNPKYNSAFEPYGRWTPSHSKTGGIFFDLTQGMMQSDNTGIPVTAPGVTSPQAGLTGKGDSAGDLYETYINGALNFSKQHNGGWSSGAQLIDEEFHMNSDDHPNYFQPSGEYNNTIIHDIEGYDDGRTGQIVALQVGLENSHTKGFQAQEQLLNFNGSYTGKSGHWDIVGGTTDKTYEPSSGGWEHTIYEVDGAGTGPDSVRCEYIADASCGRQGIVMTPSMYNAPISHDVSSTYVAKYDSNGNINSNSPRHKYYVEDQSSHITIPNMRSYVDQYGATISVSGIYRAAPKEGLYGKMTNSETTTDDGGIYTIDYIETECGYWCQAGGGYSVGSVETPSDTRIPALTVKSVDSNGGVTGYTYSANRTPFSAPVGTSTINYTTTKGWHLIAHLKPVWYAVADITIDNGGTGYKVGDLLSSTSRGVSVTVSSVDASGVITGITTTSDHRLFNNDPAGSQSLTGGSGSGGSIAITSTYGYNVNSVAETPVFS